MNAKQRFVFIDYLRIFAFLSVLFDHRFPHSPLAQFRGVDVTIFFLVSGYVVTYAAQTHETWVFGIKRIFRIYPLYITAVLLQTAVLYFYKHKAPVLEHLIPQMLLLGDFFHTPYALSGVEWTLRIEIVFYLFMTLLGSIGAFQKNCERVPLYYF